MTHLLLVRRSLSDYARNPTNLVFLVVVPIVFVMVAADRMADAARLLGGAGAGAGIETSTAGWAAGFLAAVAMYFQVSAARDADRRLVLAGLSGVRLVTARMAAGGALALLAAVAALVALAARTGIDEPWRVAAGTLMFALIYLAFGAIAGATVPNPVNGTVILMFVWIIDVFFGPTLSSTDSVVTRLLPTYFVSLWTVDLAAGHRGRSELAWSLLWTAAAVLAAVVVVVRTSTLGRRRAARAPGAAWGQLRTGLKMGLHDWRRTPVFWILLIVVPAVFIWLADLVTPHGSTPITLREGGARVTEMVDPAHIHGGTMSPVAVGSLAALTGVFIVLDARSADRRLTLAGQRFAVVLVTRMGMVMLAAGLATATSVAVTSTVFEPHQWGVYVAANALVAITYALLGVLLGPLFGRVSGVFMAFLIPFLDLGIGQSPMLQGEPAQWARYLPGYGSIRVLIDGALTSTFDGAASLIIATAWIVALTLAAVVVFRRSAAAPGSSNRARAFPVREVAKAT